MGNVLKATLSGAFWSDAADAYVVRADFVEKNIQQLEAELKRKDEVLMEIFELTKRHKIWNAETINAQIADKAREGMK